MAVIKIRTSTKVRRIWVNVTCMECGNNFNVQMKGASTKKNCPFCNDGTFHFTLTIMPGWLEIAVDFLGADWELVEYLLHSDGVEIAEEKD